MAFDFGTIATIVKTAYDAYKQLKDLFDSSDEPSSQDLLNAIRDIGTAVESARAEVISEIRGTYLADLTGDVNGLAVRFEEYTVYNRHAEHDQWFSEGERLREVIDDGADAIGHLEEELKRLDLTMTDQLEYSAQVFPVFAVAMPLRAAAMLERTRHYSTQDADHIAAMRNRLCAQMERLLPALRAGSDRRFSDVQTRRGEPAGGGKYYYQIYYEFKGTVRIVSEVLPQNVPAAVTRAKKKLQQHKDQVFRSYLCVPVIGNVDL